MILLADISIFKSGFFAKRKLTFIQPINIFTFFRHYFLILVLVVFPCSSAFAVDIDDKAEKSLERQLLPALGISKILGRWDQVIKLGYDPRNAPGLFSDQAYFMSLLAEAALRWEKVSGIKFELLPPGPYLDDRSQQLNYDGVVSVRWENLGGSTGGRAGPVSRYGSEANEFVVYHEGGVELNFSGSFWDGLGPVDMLGTLTHELGHLIGLGHSDNPGSMMYANPYNGLNYPTEDDIRAVQTLYGLPSISIDPSLALVEWQYNPFPSTDREPIFSVVKLIANESELSGSQITDFTSDRDFLYAQLRSNAQDFVVLSELLELVLVDPNGYIHSKNVTPFNCPARSICTISSGLIRMDVLKKMPGDWKIYINDNVDKKLIHKIDFVVETNPVFNSPPSARLVVSPSEIPNSMKVKVVVDDKENDQVSVTWGVHHIEMIGMEGSSEWKTLDVGISGKKSFYIQVNDSSRRYYNSGDGFQTLLRVDVTAPFKGLHSVDVTSSSVLVNKNTVNDLVTILSTGSPTPTYSIINVDSSGASSVPISGNESGTSGTTQYSFNRVSGSSVTLTAPASAGNAQFDRWAGCNSTNSSNRTCSLSSISSNQSVTAVYTTPNYTINVDSSGASSVPINGNVSGTSGITQYSFNRESGSSVTLTAPASAGNAQFDRWTGCSSSSNRTCTLSSINGNQSVTAVYNSLFGADALARALGAPHSTVSTSGSQGWIVDSAQGVGGSSVRSGNITHNQQSQLETTIVGPTEVSFRWKVSSEYSFDVLRFEINGSEATRISGEVDWTQRSFTLPAGAHNLRWIYSKDESIDLGSDAGWVDQFMAVEAETYTINVNSSGASSVPISGSVSGTSGTTQYFFNRVSGSSVTLTAPGSVGNAQFDRWTGCSSTDISNRTCSLSSISGNHSVMAVYNSAGYMTPSVPTNVSASDGSFADSVEISWSQSGAASSYSYIVWRCSSADISTCNNAAINFISGYRYVSDAFAPGEPWYFRVQTCAGEDNCSALSEPDIGFTKYIPLRTPTNFSLVNEDNGFRAYWDEVDGATSYTLLLCPDTGIENCTQLDNAAESGQFYSSSAGRIGRNSYVRVQSCDDITCHEPSPYKVWSPRYTREATWVFSGKTGDYLLSRHPSTANIDIIPKAGTGYQRLTLPEGIENLQFQDGMIEQDQIKNIGYWGRFSNVKISDNQAVRRFINLRNNAFFYTSSLDEANFIIGKSYDETGNSDEWGYVYQGSTFGIARSYSGAVPLHRFYNFSTGHHFFTASRDEAEYINSKIDTDDWPFNYEGTSFSVYPADPNPNFIGGEMPVYRLYNPSYGGHFFTADETERQLMLETGVWNDEGIGFWAERNR